MSPLKKISASRKLDANAIQIKNHFVAVVGEFIGTTMFLFFAYARTQIANLPTANPGSPTTSEPVNISNILFISLSFGFSLMVKVWIFFRISGGLFNPAISLVFGLVGIISPLRAALLVVAQILGGMTAAALVDALLPGSWYVSTRLGGGINTAQGLFLEMFMTAELVFVLLFWHLFGIGLALFIAELAGAYYTGGSLNPARSFGPAVVIHSFDHYHWIYWLGPVLGAFLATGFYLFIKVLDYEEVNGDQDKDEVDAHLRKVKRNRHHHPHFRNAPKASYMHVTNGGTKNTAHKLAVEQHTGEEDTKKSSETAPVKDLDIIAGGEGVSPEQMV